MPESNLDALSLSEAQVLFFRARRTHLAGPGAPDARTAARALIGAQAQVDGPALFALSQRTEGRPSAAALKLQLLESHDLVRTWGQRDTLHVYDPSDWPAVIAARPEWPQSGRRGAMPTGADLAAARAVFERSDEPVFRRDLFDHIAQRYVDEVAEHPGAGADPVRMAASRLIWHLALNGEICFAHKDGSEQSYAKRTLWFGDLAWPADPAAASLELARRYLSSFGPATPADIAHFFGSRVGIVKGWLDSMASELIGVDCGHRNGLLALARDHPELAEEPGTVENWPVRLLPKWDTHTMTHKDKSWVMPDRDEQPLVWKKAGVIEPTVLVRGRFAATWSHRAMAKKVVVTVRPLGLWRRSYASAVENEARALAAHLGRVDAEVVIL